MTVYTISPRLVLGFITALFVIYPSQSNASIYCVKSLTQGQWRQASDQNSKPNLETLKSRLFSTSVYKGYGKTLMINLYPILRGLRDAVEYRIFDMVIDRE